MATDQNGCWWWHSITLGDGVVTPGEKSAAVLEEEWRNMALPSLRGKTVLDIGAWDGWFSFAAERAGASRVVALDWFVWSLDFTNAAAYHTYANQRKEAGLKPLIWGPECPWWDDKTLPGKRGFETARAVLGSRVEDIVLDFNQLVPQSIGLFDVVFFLGVFYHLQEPLAALRRLRSVTKELAVIETAAIDVPEQERRSLVEFLADDKVNEDPTNWWFPTERAMHDLLWAAGFESVQTVAHSSKTPRAGGSDYRLTVHASP
jgi:tRNA (mo5U34)-methyltransferase